jgi:hypothetical protein
MKKADKIVSAHDFGPTLEERKGKPVVKCSRCQAEPSDATETCEAEGM